MLSFTVMNPLPSPPNNGLNGFEPEPLLSDDIRRYSALALHWGWFLLLVTFAAGALAYFVSSQQPRIYTAQATMLIRESRVATQSSDAYSNERLAQTFSKMMIQQPVLEGVIQQLNLNITPDALKGNIQVQVVPDTQLIVVSVEDTIPERAALIANTIGTVFATQNQASQASLYAETKQNLSAQIASTEQQIQQTIKAQEALGSPSSTDAERGLLEAQLATYYQIYDELLRQMVLFNLEQNNGEGGANLQTLNDKLAEVDQLIRTTKQQLDEIGGNTATGIERDRLEANLALYRQTYANLVQSFEQVRLAEIENTSNVELVEPALPPQKPIRPNVLEATIIAMLAGLFGATGVVFLVETLDDTVKGPDDVVRHLGLSVLNVIGHIEQKSDVPITAQQPRSPISESFRALRTNIEFAGVDKPIRTLLVTSPGPQDGKSTITANLGVIMAQGQKRTILLDADLRRPSMHTKFKTSNRNGLTDLFLNNRVGLKDALHPTQIPGLAVLSTGPLPANPAELIGTKKMREIIQKTSEIADIVIFDTPPVMVVTDPTILAAQVDGVLLVLRVGVTKLSMAKHSLEQLHRAGANVLGVVLNDISQKRSRYYYYNRYHNMAYYDYGVKSLRRSKKAGNLG